MLRQNAISEVESDIGIRELTPEEEKLQKKWMRKNKVLKRDGNKEKRVKVIK